MFTYVSYRHRQHYLKYLLEKHPRLLGAFLPHNHELLDEMSPPIYRFGELGPNLLSDNPSFRDFTRDRCREAGGVSPAQAGFFREEGVEAWSRRDEPEVWRDLVDLKGLN